MQENNKTVFDTFPNLYRHKATHVMIRHTYNHTRGSYFFVLRYIPDKLLVQPTSFADELDKLLDCGTTTEDHYDLAHDIIESLMDQLIPKWLDITIKKDAVCITMEDRQPDFNDESYLRRLPTQDT